MSYWEVSQRFGCLATVHNYLYDQVRRAGAWAGGPAAQRLGGRSKRFLQQGCWLRSAASDGGGSGAARRPGPRGSRLRLLPLTAHPPARPPAPAALPQVLEEPLQDHECLIDFIAVSPEARGKGVGGLLMTWAQDTGAAILQKQWPEAVAAHGPLMSLWVSQPVRRGRSSLPTKAGTDGAGGARSSAGQRAGGLLNIKGRGCPKVKLASRSPTAGLAALRAAPTCAVLLGAAGGCGQCRGAAPVHQVGLPGGQGHQRGRALPLPLEPRAQGLPGAPRVVRASTQVARRLRDAPPRQLRRGALRWPGQRRQHA